WLDRVQSVQPAHRGEAPVLLTAAGDLEGLQVVGGEPLPRAGDRLEAGSGLGPRELGCQAGDFLGRHPTEPSICSSISRFSSRAYSIGSSRAIGSTKPRTTMAIASSSVRPRRRRWPW